MVRNKILWFITKDRHCPFDSLVHLVRARWPLTRIDLDFCCIYLHAQFDSPLMTICKLKLTRVLLSCFLHQLGFAILEAACLIWFCTTSSNKNLQVLRSRFSGSRSNSNSSCRSSSIYVTRHGTSSVVSVRTEKLCHQLMSASDKPIVSDFQQLQTPLDWRHQTMLYVYFGPNTSLRPEKCLYLYVR